MRLKMVRLSSMMMDGYERGASMRAKTIAWASPWLTSMAVVPMVVGRTCVMK